jgi:PAS domain S-box-containing protein
LRESEARTRAIVNSAADGIITTNDLGIITGFNAAAEKIFGHSVSDAMGKSVNILLPEEVAGDHDGFIGNFLKTGDAKIIGIGREVEGRRKDGSSFPMELALSATDITGGTIFTGIVRDISERKEAEDKLHHTLDELRQTQDVLVQSEKMASLGGLVAGVAHEINTPVGIGVTASSHLSEAVGNLRRSFAGGTLKKSELEASFETIDQASEMISTNLRRAAELIGSFKQVAVDQSSEEKREFQVGEYLDEIILSLHPKIKQTKHRVSVDCDSSLLVNSYPGAISQIITNLVMNSLIHAYDDGDEGSIRISALDNGDHITLKYFDDGKGMDTESLKKIFDPFFTTKRGSGGSGLGMNILYNLVTQTLGGTVVCDSQPGEGTTFTITFSNKEKPPLEQRAAG